MADYPTPVLHYLLQHAGDIRHLGYVYVAPNRTVIDAGGSLAFYGLCIGDRNRDVQEYLYFLHGLLPLDETGLVIPFLQLDEHFVDLHLFPGALGDWVLWFDVSDAVQQQRELQHRVYHLQ